MGESIERTLGRIEGKLDAVLAEQALEPDRRKAVYSRFEAQDTRIDLVEKWQVRLIAAGTVALFLIGVGYKVVLDIARLGHN